MITKTELLNYAKTKFTQFGSKHVTLDEIASDLGISKKTIYSFFKNKEDLVAGSLEILLKEYEENINSIITSYSNDTVLCVILIYKRGFEYLKYFKPSFLFGLKKYYPKANKLFEDFIENLSKSTILSLLKKAQEQGHIKPEVNLELIVKIYFFRVDNLLFKNNNLFELYGEDTLFKHFVLYNLSGIISKQYFNPYLK
ncbi:TetR family transcriptional regulator [Seonamhaeicola sp. S2-3]|uniref:TetR/AcrR family transcriptional regulator n=1 Tax=Seonamhaeicola sp. S2-3 TaxID=1936081 RepID=UPI0009726869|nr:TetR/AcrR family transcriptional regulator [Seonamhaeicola sp. S2-3]APY10838.1 TetR family transcriptional regulator [Seonamhaeicola sp. S2-3]